MEADPSSSEATNSDAHVAFTRHGLAATRGRTLRTLRLVVGMALLLPTLAYVAVAWWLYRTAFDEARRTLDATARVAQEQALKLFDTNEMLLQRMLDLIGDRSDAELLDQGPDLHARLVRMVSQLPQVQGLFAFGADGRMVATSRAYPPPRQLDYSDRAWYQAHRRGDAPIFVTEQIISRLNGEAAFDMSRRRTHADGSFAGSVNVSLRPEYLTNFYSDLAEATPDLRVTVIRGDGAILARWPGPMQIGRSVDSVEPLMQQIAQGSAEGSGEGLSPVDGTPRLRHFRKLGDYPLYVITTLGRDTVVATWMREAALLGLFVFPTAIGFAWMAWVSLQHTRRQFEASQRLEDETARRQRAELALMHSQKLEAMGRLTGGVAHDFNNLLAVVGSSLEVLRRLRPELVGTPQVGAIDRAVTSGSKLTRQLLAFARKQALLPERVLLQERLGTLCELLRPLLGSSIQLQWSAAEDTDPIEVDTAELELALINVAANAGDAMREGGKLTIAARNADPAELPATLQGDFVVIDIDDTGPGIASHLAERVFEPLFTTKPIGKGTGLGLSQVRAMCHAAGGDARIEPAPDGGARVRLFLKRSDAPAPKPEALVVDTARLDARILLVEDNDEVADAMQQLLEAMGCRVERVRDGRDALSAVAVRRAAFDLVLSDIEMPGGLDGIALAGQLMRSDPGLPVVLMTGYAVRLEQAVRERLEVLPKPCTPAMLAEAIRRALSRRPASPLAA
ncbi:MAG: response regulator [Burkholderiaceae bacterium]